MAAADLSPLGLYRALIVTKLNALPLALLVFVSACTSSSHLISSGVTPAKPSERILPGGGHVGSFGREKHDPLENDPRYHRAFQETDSKTKRKLAGVQRGLGFVHLYWQTKKQILRRDYGLDWKTPAELNPNISYD
jgi:hypothetical protein